MIVAWQFIARGRFNNGSVPQARYDGVCTPQGKDRFYPEITCCSRTPLTDHLIPSRWDGPHFFHSFQAVNCQATIIQSLRDKDVFLSSFSTARQANLSRNFVAKDYASSPRGLGVAYQSRITNHQSHLTSHFSLLRFTPAKLPSPYARPRYGSLP